MWGVDGFVEGLRGDKQKVRREEIGVNGARASRSRGRQGQEDSGKVGQGVKERERERGDRTSATDSYTFPAAMKDRSESS